MNEDRLKELLARCESLLEREIPTEGIPTSDNSIVTLKNCVPQYKIDKYSWSAGDDP